MTKVSVLPLYWLLQIPPTVAAKTPGMPAEMGNHAGRERSKMMHTKAAFSATGR